MTDNENYLDFCARSFWGKWDQSLLKITALFIVAALTIYAGRTSGVLFGAPDVVSVLATAFMATIMTAGLGLARKKKKI